MSCPRCGHTQPFPHHYTTDTKRSIVDMSHYECNKCGLKFWRKYRGQIKEKTV